MGANNNGNRIDMLAVAEQVRAAGHGAFVDHSGGGHMTIFAGPVDDLPDAAGDYRRAVLAGPGFNYPDGVFGDATDFAVGPDDDGATTPVLTPHTVTTEQVADLIVDQIGKQQGRWARIRAAVQPAEQAFWAAIAAQFPEVTSGDYAGDNLLPTLHQAVLDWLAVNQPKQGIAPTLDEARQAVEAGRVAAAKRLAAVAKLGQLSYGTLTEMARDESRHAAENATEDSGDPDSRDERVNAAAKRADDAVSAGPDAILALLHDLVGEEDATEMLIEQAGYGFTRQQDPKGGYQVLLYLDSTLIDRREQVAPVDVFQAKTEMFAQSGGWAWNVHSGDIGDWCQHSNELAPPPGVDGHAHCPAGCQDSRAERD